MAAGGGESPHPPQSSWGSGPRPPTRALTCTVRCGARSGRAAPRPAALPLRAPPGGVARAGASPRRRSAASECPQANNSPRASPARLRKLPSGPRAPQDRTLAVFSPLASLSRPEDARQCLGPPRFPYQPTLPRL